MKGLSGKQHPGHPLYLFTFLRSGGSPETGHRNVLWKGVEHLWDNTGQHLYQTSGYYHTHTIMLSEKHTV